MNTIQKKNNERRNSWSYHGECCFPKKYLEFFFYLLIIDFFKKMCNVGVGVFFWLLKGGNHDLWSNMLSFSSNFSPCLCVYVVTVYLCVYVVKPSISEAELATVDVQPYMSGKQHHLTCTAFGLPLPTITWHWQPFHSEPKFKKWVTLMLCSVCHGWAIP